MIPALVSLFGLFLEFNSHCEAILGSLPRVFDERASHREILRGQLRIALDNEMATREQLAHEAPETPEIERSSGMAPLERRPRPESLVMSEYDSVACALGNVVLATPLPAYVASLLPDRIIALSENTSTAVRKNMTYADWARSIVGRVDLLVALTNGDDETGPDFADITGHRKRTLYHDIVQDLGALNRERDSVERESVISANNGFPTRDVAFDLVGPSRFSVIAPEGWPGLIFKEHTSETLEGAACSLPDVVVESDFTIELRPDGGGTAYELCKHILAAAGCRNEVLTGLLGTEAAPAPVVRDLQRVFDKLQSERSELEFSISGEAVAELFASNPRTIALTDMVTDPASKLLCPSTPTGLSHDFG